MRAPVPHTFGTEPFVLIVDDEIAVLEVVRTMACSLGWRPLLADTAAAALDLFRQHAGTISHVLLDLHMPEVDGALLARDIRRLRPDVHIAFMTGDELGARALMREGQLAQALLVKPFVLDALADVLSEHARAA